MYQVIPSISIKPTHFTTYCQVENSERRHNFNQMNYAMPIENKTHGIISAKANKRVKLAIDWLLAIADDKKLKKKNVKTNFTFKVNFITLTLSSKQIHSDKEIKHTFLNQFLTELRDKWNCKNYLWRAETQRNGNIHFHIVSDTFIPWRQLRTDWNRIQEKLGYITRFTKKTGLHDPNSTDIHSVNKIKNLSAYLSKYCGKNSKGYTIMLNQATPSFPEEIKILNYKHVFPKKDAHFFRPVTGKLWGLSNQLSKLKSAIHCIDSEIEKEIDFLSKNFPERVKFMDRVSLFVFNVNQLFELKCNSIAQKLVDYAKKILHPPKIEIPLQEITIKKIIPVFFQSNISF